MRFPREFRGYISNPRALAAARVLAFRWSYVFQLHVFVAFMVSLVLMPQVVGLLETFADAVQQVPSGITFIKKGSELTVTGLQQPYTLSANYGAILIDTTGATQQRPASSTAFISKTDIDFVSGKVAWSEMSDLRVTSDQLRSALVDHFGAFVTVIAIMVFVYFFFASAITTAFLTISFSLITVVVQRVWVKVESQHSLRDIFAVNLVAITGPLALWGLLTALGFPIGALVEVVALIVYSIVGLSTSLEWLGDISSFENDPDHKNGGHKK